MFKNNKAFVICWLATLFYFFDYFVQVTPSVISASLSQQFHLTTKASFGLLGFIFLLPYCLLQLPAGIALQRYGTRRCLSLAAFFSAGALWIFAHTHSWALALASRAMLGACAAFSFISAVNLVSQWVPKRYFASVTGMIQISASLGSIIGLGPIVFAVKHWHWQTVIASMGMVSLCLALLFLVFIRDKNFKDRRLQPLHFKDTLSYLNQNRSLFFIFMVGFIAWIPISSIGALWGVPYLNALGLPTGEGAHCVSFLWIGLGLGSVFMGCLSERLGSRRLPTLLCFVFCIMGSLVLIEARYCPVWLVAIALFFIGVSAGNQALSFAWLKDRCPPHLFTSFSGLNNMAAILGGAFAQLSLGIGLTQLKSLGYTGHEGLIHSYQLIFLMIPISSAVGFFIALFQLNQPVPSVILESHSF
jgi:MFS family permease